MNVQLDYAFEPTRVSGAITPCVRLNAGVRPHTCIATMVNLHK
jgi:hypothetical protein